MQSQDLFTFLIKGRARNVLIFLRVKIKEYIGIFSAVIGSVVATSGQFIDPAKSRARAIGLKTVMIQLENLAENSQVQSLGLQKEQAATTELVTLNKDFMDEFVKIKKEALDLGVDV